MLKERQVPTFRDATTGTNDSKGTEDKSLYYDQVDDVDVVIQRLQPVQNTVKSAQVQTRAQMSQKMPRWIHSERECG